MLSADVGRGSSPGRKRQHAAVVVILSLMLFANGIHAQLGGAEVASIAAEQMVDVVKNVVTQLLAGDGEGKQLRPASDIGGALTVTRRDAPDWCALPWNWGKWECDALLNEATVEEETNLKGQGWKTNDRGRMYADYLANTVCLNGWDMQQGSDDRGSYDARVTRCDNGWDHGLVESIIIRADELNRIYVTRQTPLFTIRVESKPGYCLTFQGRSSMTQFLPCDASGPRGMDQLWFVPSITFPDLKPDAPPPASPDTPAASPCDKCNLPEAQGGCKCDNNCGCLATDPPVADPPAGSPCDKCNLPEAQGGCKCDNNCDCIAAGRKLKFYL